MEYENSFGGKLAFAVGGLVARRRCTIITRYIQILHPRLIPPCTITHLIFTERMNPLYANDISKRRVRKNERILLVKVDGNTF